MTALVLSLVALAIALLALSLAVSVTRRVGLRDPIAVPPLWRRVLRIRTLPPVVAAAGAERAEAQERVAFIVNPTKAGVAELREQALRACAIRYLPQPLWFYTTEEDPGRGQTAEALAAGADVVVAVGGDGTVRAVAHTLAGTGVPLGIVPMGTGNLFARNLDLPLDDQAALLRAALEGAERPSDVGWIELDRPTGDEPERERERDDRRHIFLVIAGAGLDAEMVAGANDQLKRRLGWVAYFYAALRHLGKRMEAHISVDGAEPVESSMRTVLIANVGRLPGGLRLIPDASFHDGRLDVASIDARGGIVGWSELFGTVVSQGAGIRDPWLLRTWKTSRIDHVRGTRVEIRLRDPQKVQVDGDSLGHATRISARIQAQALTLRVPRETLEEGPRGARRRAGGTGASSPLTRDDARAG
ncbi:diacylglycerol/lipid kinase family protein [Demequina pelophila]|uniref:diacylglycerol/lipid kinase family protein n=1 Tax=Demequina pelophila TaxID=1638984 RepID=UPI0007819B26|nr:diacylglycerol kinase family protein [Demequina pelophila]